MEVCGFPEIRCILVNPKMGPRAGKFRLRGILENAAGVHQIVDEKVLLYESDCGVTGHGADTIQFAIQTLHGASMKENDLK